MDEYESLRVRKDAFDLTHYFWTKNPWNCCEPPCQWNQWERSPKAFKGNFPDGH